MVNILRQRDIIDRRALAEALAQAVADAPAAGLDRAVLLPPLKEALARGRAEIHRRFAAWLRERGTEELIETGKRWLQAGAVRLVVEARESAQDVGLFSAPGEFDSRQADHLAEAFGLEQLLFEAPNKASQFALIDHFGPAVQLGNVRLEEVLRVEIYRRGLHSDAFRRANLRPRPPADA